MPSVAKGYEALARSARNDGWPYEDFLKEILEAEVRSRREHAAQNRIRDARFPEVKTLDQLEWDALKGVSRPKMLELASGDWIGKAECVVIAGPVGTGKTHLAIALGVEATRRRHRVSFWRAADLVRELTEARDERTLGRLHQRLRRASLLLGDELGFVPFGRAGRQLPFKL